MSVPAAAAASSSGDVQMTVRDEDQAGSMEAQAARVDALANGASEAGRGAISRPMTALAAAVQMQSEPRRNKWVLLAGLLVTVGGMTMVISGAKAHDGSLILGGLAATAAGCFISCCGCDMPR